MAQLFDTGIFSAIFADSSIMSGATLNWYDVGTTTPKNTYTTSAKSVANANPVVADANGRWPAIWFDESNYKYVLKDAAGNVLVTRDGIQGVDAYVVSLIDAQVADISTLQGATFGDGTIGVTMTLQGTAAKVHAQRYASDLDPVDYTGDIARGTFASPTACATTDAVRFVGRFYGATGLVEGGLLSFSVLAATPSDTDMQTSFAIKLCAAASVTATNFLAGSHAAGLAVMGTTKVDPTGAIINASATAAAIAAIGNAINTANKVAGKQVWDTTNHRLMIANGPLAADAWYVADASANVVPA